MGMRYEPERGGATDKINVLANWELNYWATRWGVTPDELIRAVAEVGTNVRIVQAHLGRSGLGGSAVAAEGSGAFAP